MHSLISADVDGDGDVDLLAAAYQDGVSGEIFWFENLDGLGQYGPAQFVTTSAESVLFILAADVDGDGDTDVLSVETNGVDYVAWYPNGDGAGTFLSRQIIPSGSTSEIAVADLDGDGDLDVIRRDIYSEIAWNENVSGTGDFGPSQRIHATGGWPTALDVADLDGDGDLDILYATDEWLSYYPIHLELRPAELKWAENTDGAGAFGPPQLLPHDYVCYDVVAADLDEDDDLDVACLWNDIAWFENTDGAGTFGTRQSAAVTACCNFEQVITTDIDSDGDDDFVLPRPSVNVALGWYENTDGAGDFGPTRIISAVPPFARHVVAADLNGDGRVDLATISWDDDSIQWYAQVGVSDPLDPDSDDDGLLDGDEVLIFGTDPGLADTDGDGLTDFEEVNGTGTNPLLADTDGDGLDDGVETGTGIFVSASDTGTNPLVADTDGDLVSDGDEVAAGTDPNDPSDGEPPLPVPLLGPGGVGVLMLLLAGLGLRRTGES